MVLGRLRPSRTSTARRSRGRWGAGRLAEVRSDRKKESNDMIELLDENRALQVEENPHPGGKYPAQSERRASRVGARVFVTLGSRENTRQENEGGEGAQRPRERCAVAERVPAPLRHGKR